MAEKRTQPMTVEAMRKAVTDAEASLHKARGVLTERQRKIDAVDKNLKEAVYRERVSSIHREADAKVSEVLSAGKSFDSLSLVLAQRKEWTVEKYLARHAVTLSSDVAREMGLARLVEQMRYLDGEGLAALADEALSRRDLQVAGITWQVVTGRLRNPPQVPAELDALLAAKTNLEATESYPEIGAVTALTREADEMYTGLVDVSRYAQGLTQAIAHDLNPTFFTPEQRKQWGIPEPTAA